MVRIIFFMVLGSICWNTQAQTVVVSNTHVYLLIGQSNMAGRGVVDTESKLINPHIIMLDSLNHWVPATDPVHFDKPSAGVGPAISFAKTIKGKNKKIKIALVPCAWGGSPIKVWEPGASYLKAHPYDDAIKRVKIAMQTGVLKGIIWHQGESDNDSINSKVYLEKLVALVSRLRKDLQLPNLPFVAGEIGYFNKKDFINKEVNLLPQRVSNTWVVSAKGLAHKGDGLHFNTASARELGKRYAEAMLQLQKKTGTIKELKTAQINSQEVLSVIEKVNAYWQQNHLPQQRSFWDEAAYHTGNMAAYELTGNKTFLQYSKDWAEHNNWMGAKSNDKEKCKYRYGETDEYVLFGDWQICFQTYIDLYNIEPDEKKIARAKEVMQYEISTSRNDYWWWVDGLYMVMPVMTKLYKLTGDKSYLDKLYEYFTYSVSIMYDSQEKLFYRDAKYPYPAHKTVNGKKDFWARGDGWVFAGLAKVLQDMPKSYEHYDYFKQKYLDMAAALVPFQQAEGYWTRSMMDPEHAPGAETSGTAFFTYGYLWGINNGLLDKKTYFPTAEKGWKYLTNTALQPNGAIGFVQPIGEKAIPGQVVDKNSTANFGVAAFLLAACEMYKFSK